MKRFLCVCLIFILMTGILSLSVVALAPPSKPQDSDTTSTLRPESDTQFKYSVGNNEVRITDVVETVSGEVVIPSEYLGKPVTTISEYLFYNCPDVTSIVLPDSITWIGSSAFEETKYYKDPKNWDNGILYIGKHLIKVSPTVSGKVVVRPDTLTVAANAFLRCAAITSVTLPDSLVTVGQGAFYGCENLHEVKLGKGLKLIDHSAFGECSKLSAISIPDGVKEIGSLAFTHCDSLTSVVLPKSLMHLGASVFSKCKRLASVTMPEVPVTEDFKGIVYISSDTFAGCSALKTINIPESVFNIEARAFNGCSSLSSLKLPDGLTQIGDAAFGGCSSLTAIDIPENVTSIGYGAFNGCSSIKTVKLPKGITTISDSMFEDCISLTKIEIHDGIATIGSKAFGSCKSLQSVVIPENVAVIKESAFENCDKLNNVTLPDTAIKICNNAFFNSGCYKNNNSWRDGTLYIGNHLIKAKDVSGTKTVDSSTVTVADNAFEGCAKLRKVEIYAGVLRIGENAFSQCTDLSEVSLPDCVLEIGKDAFFGTMYFDNERANWQDGVLYNGKHLIGVNEEKLPERFTVKEGTLTIADHALSGCYSLLKVDLPDGLKHIGKGAFAGCTALLKINAPDSIESIGENAFSRTYYCLNDEYWEDGGLYIGRHLIEAEVHGDGSFKIKDGTLTVGEAVFKKGARLKTLTIPNSVKVINDYAFSECTLLETVYFYGDKGEISRLINASGDYYLESATWKFLKEGQEVDSINDPENEDKPNVPKRTNVTAWVIVLITLAVIVFATATVLVADKKKK